MRRTDLIRMTELSGHAEGMRVLFVTNMWPDEVRPYYGSFIASQARSLADIGVNVDVCYIRGFLGAAAYRRAVGRLPRLVARRKYDIVHIHYGHSIAASVRVRHKAMVFSFCGEDLLGAPRWYGVTPKSRLEICLFRQLARRAAATITKSKEMELVLPSAVRSRNHVIPNGVDMTQFEGVGRAKARRALGWRSEEYVLLFLGNPADPRKNVALAHAAAELVARKVAPTRLHIAWKVPPNDVPLLLSAADCLVFPSKSEGSPNAVKEAMACELPIVATAVGDVAELLDGVTNCYIRKAAAPEFADGVVRALAAGRAPAARIAIDRLRIDRVAERLIYVYEGAQARRRISECPSPVTSA